MQAGRGFLLSRAYIDVVVKSLIFVWQQELRENFTPATSDAWETLFRYMVQKTNEGYANATKGNATTNAAKGSEVEKVASP